MEEARTGHAGHILRLGQAGKDIPRHLVPLHVRQLRHSPARRQTAAGRRTRLPRSALIRVPEHAGIVALRSRPRMVKSEGLAWMSPLHDEAHPLARSFRSFLAEPTFPCLGAKSALSRNKIEIMVATDFSSDADDGRIYRHLLEFVGRDEHHLTLFCSFVVLFESPRNLCETGFEHHLWARLQSLSDQDASLGVPYDGRVAAQPGHPHFSLSIGSEAFFVVGLHPHSSRKSRRFEAPALVFNLHAQFERLRADGRYDRLRSRIAQRDAVYSGSVNPMLARHGERSEAPQYSGRAVDEAWECPLRPREDAQRA